VEPIRSRVVEPRRRPALSRSRDAGRKAGAEQQGRRLPAWLSDVRVLVAGLTVIAAGLRVATATRSLFGDELSTHWVVTEHGFFEVVSIVHANWEITPPLYFLLAWLTTWPDVSPVLLRLPSLVAGIAAVPLVYLLGKWTFGRTTGVVAAALTAFSPFMIFYSSEARAYELMIVLVVVSTLALLKAAEERRTRWWAAYAISSCAAMYSHYTAVFPLLCQFLWLLWAHPAARKPALQANLGAAMAFLPWFSGVRKDFSSPTTEVLSALTPFNLDSARISLQHWSVGHPFAYPRTALRELPGDVALVMLAAGVLIGLFGVIGALLASRPCNGSFSSRPRAWLIVLLALSVPAGEAVASALGDNLFGTRNLAASWPAFAVALAALVTAAGRLRVLAVALVVGAFAIGGAKMVDSSMKRPDFAAAAAFVETSAGAGDIVIDGAVIAVTPGPLSPLDVELDGSAGVFRVGAPQQRRHPFRLADPILPTDEAVRRAVDSAENGRIFLVMLDPETTLGDAPLPAAVTDALPPRYRLRQVREYPGMVDVLVLVYGPGDRR
jgi:hypothetical protein